MDDTAKGGLTQYILGTFYRDSFRAQRFQTLISLLFEDHWVEIKNEGSLELEKVILLFLA